MTGYKYIIANPDRTTLTSCVTNVLSEWTQVSQIDYIEFSGVSVSETINCEHTSDKVIPGDARLIISLRKNRSQLQFQNMFIGNLDDVKTRKFRAGLLYIKSEWAKKSNKYSIIFRATTNTTATAELGYGTIENATNTEGWTLWTYGSGFKRPKGIIRDVQFSEDTNNNLTLQSLVIDLANK